MCVRGGSRAGLSVFIFPVYVYHAQCIYKYSSLLSLYPPPTQFLWWTANLSFIYDSVCPAYIVELFVKYCMDVKPLRLN